MYYCIIHIDIIVGKIWIQANNTDCLIAEELVTAGISAKSIVLGMQPPEVRPYRRINN
ncbi:MAG: element excision factor XisI family protein [Cyanobacteriota bacterium]|nr:element excision factor XisI family protein [Cyanobacteriota bacterium]